MQSRTSPETRVDNSYKPDNYESTYQSLARYQLALAAGFVPRGRPTDEAARHQSLDILKWERARGCDWDWVTCALAAEGGHLDVLTYLRASGCDWSPDVCAYAAKGGHLEILQWLARSGCDWNHWTCAYAAKGGHLEMLQWARAHGCDCRPSTGTSRCCSGRGTMAAIGGRPARTRPRAGTLRC